MNAKGYFFSRTQLINGHAFSKGIDHEQITLAIEVMDSNGHDEAHFGMGGGFIYSQSQFEEENVPRH